MNLLPTTVQLRPQQLLNLKPAVAAGDHSNAWLSADYDNKERLQFLIIPDGIVYNKEKREIRTSSMNSLFMLMSSKV